MKPSRFSEEPIIKVMKEYLARFLVLLQWVSKQSGRDLTREVKKKAKLVATKKSEICDY